MLPVLWYLSPSAALTPLLNFKTDSYRHLTPGNINPTFIQVLSHLEGKTRFSMADPAPQGLHTVILILYAS